MKRAAALVLALLLPACVQRAHTVKGYPVYSKHLVHPTSVDSDLDNSFPKTGSVLEKMLKGRNPG